MKCLSFSFKHWQYPFVLSFLTFFQICLGFCLIRSFKTRNGMIVSMLNSLSSILLIILELISYLLTHRDKKVILLDQTRRSKYIATTHLFFPIVEVPEKRMNSLLIFSLTILALQSIFPNMFIMICIYNTLTFFTNLYIFFGIIFTWAISYFLMKGKLYKHQYISLSIILLDLIAYFIVMFEDIGSMIDDLYINIGLFILFFLLYTVPSATRESIEKYVMQIHFMSPFLLLFTEGVISIILLILISLSIPESLCDQLYLSEAFFYSDICYSSRWKTVIKEIKLFFKLKTVPWLLLIGYIVIALLTNFTRIQTNKKLSPTHRYISDMFCSFYYILLVRVYDTFKFDFNFTWINSSRYITTELIQLPFIIIACLVYNENIIIRKWAMDTDTSSNITIRAIQETDSLTKILDQDENASETDVSNYTIE